VGAGPFLGRGDIVGAECLALCWSGGVEDDKATGVGLAVEAAFFQAAVPGTLGVGGRAGGSGLVQELAGAADDFLTPVRVPWRRLMLCIEPTVSRIMFCPEHLF